MHHLTFYLMIFDIIRLKFTYYTKVFCERCGMNLKINLQFIETEESKYRKNAALQIRQEVANVLKHAKLTPEPLQDEKEKDTAATEVKDGKKAEAKTNKTEQKPKHLRRKASVESFMEDSAKTVIRM